MPLAECQVQVRDLVMGPGTPYRVLQFNPWVRAVRADQGGPRAWGHGDWSGAEWAASKVVPIRVSADGASRTIGSWITVDQALAAAFAPVGDSGEAVELRWRLGGQEYVIHGRPRMVEPDSSLVAIGKAHTGLAFVALDPRIYAGTVSEIITGLPTQTGGLTVPLTVPFTVDGVLSGGREDAANAGTTDTALTARIDGPVTQPQIVVQPPTGDVQRIRFELELTAGQWLDVDTAARTALLNGLPEASQRGRATWDMAPHPLAPGTNQIRFLGGSFNEAAELTVTWRSAWW